MELNEKKIDPNFIFRAERNIKAYMLYIIIALTFVCVSLAIAIALLMPLKEVKPMLLTFSDGDSRFVTISDTSINPRSNQNLLKSILAGYVKNRELINRIDDAERYNEIRTQSSRQVWEAFSHLVSKAGSIYSTNSLFRDIKIINVSILSQNIATIDFLAEISNQSKTELSYKKYRAALEFDFRETTQTQNDAFKNPLGFIVEKYSVTDIIENDKEKK